MNLRQVFKEIVFGFSSFLFNDKEVFIKHLSVFDQIDIDQLKTDFFEKAKKRGIPTEEESFSILVDNDIWSDGDESQLSQQKLYLQNLQNTRKNLYLLSEITKINKDIEDASIKYNSLKHKKNQLIGYTAEKFAEKRVSEYYILNSLYKNKHFSAPFFSKEEIDELENDELTTIVSKYNEKFKNFEDENIQKIVLEDFFSVYMPFCEDVRSFYDKPLFDLSINQVRLIVYSRMFKNIFQNYPNIPESIKKQPFSIIDYVNSQDKAKERLKNVNKNGASTIVGAKQEDYTHLGVKQTSGKSLASMLKEKGGKMDLKDIAEAMGAV